LEEDSSAASSTLVKVPSLPLLQLLAPDGTCAATSTKAISSKNNTAATDGGGKLSQAATTLKRNSKNNSNNNCSLFGYTAVSECPFSAMTASISAAIPLFITEKMSSTCNSNSEGSGNGNCNGNDITYGNSIGSTNTNPCHAKESSGAIPTGSGTILHHHRTRANGTLGVSPRSSNGSLVTLGVCITCGSSSEGGNTEEEDMS
jgi:hypothetical protein